MTHPAVPVVDSSDALAQAAGGLRAARDLPGTEPDMPDLSGKLPTAPAARTIPWLIIS